MDKRLVGTIIKTHGIKGELVVKTNFKEASKAFKVNNTIYIDDTSYQITSSRMHKNNYLITINNLNNINNVLIYIKSDIYIDKSIKLDEIPRDELINMKVYTDKFIGKVESILISKLYDILKLDTNILIPNTKEFIIEIKDGIIYAKKLKGMTYED